MERQSSSVYICVTFQREFIFNNDRKVRHFICGFIGERKAINCRRMPYREICLAMMIVKIIDPSKPLGYIKKLQVW